MCKTEIRTVISYLHLSYDDASGSDLQIYGKRYDVHNNVAYIMTKL